LVVQSEEGDKIIINNEKVTERLQSNLAIYDKNGEMHYDIITAFIKSIRGSDPDAAVYWLARMIEGGEDVKFIARRLLILSAEDVGLANPNALLLAQSTFDAVHQIGYPESRIVLSECTIYLATSPKSNSAYEAISKAQELVQRTGNLPVPLHIRNAPTKLMKDLGYGKDYKYAHSFKGNFAEQDFLPKEIKNERLYTPQNNASEQKILERLKAWWGKRFG
jgi:putative ATPase